MDSSILNTLLVSATTFGVVFVVFTILYFVMLAMSLVSRFEKEEPPAAMPAPSAAAALPGAVSPQIVAAITAAIVADLGGDNFTITSITPLARVSGQSAADSAWASQGRERQMNG